ncbi:acetate--CoA ligase family protein [Paraburkholderia heleia]|uniref:acetate--CoA ligase family protein n=1 Tax=Paraburkholderia heleia TaxID=634127 RepID=UPI0031E3B728
MHPLSPLLNPNSIAVLGASPRAEALGNAVIRNLQRIGYAGAIYPVHPSAPDVLGIPAYANIGDISGSVDCAVIALSYDKALPALEALNARGVRNAVLYASGFAETGAEGAALQEELTRYCNQNGINLCGPNCLGLYSVASRVSLYSAALPENLRPGGLALLSHSGSACIALSNLDRLGFSHLVSLGNGAVTDIADYLDYVAQDEHTTVAALFIETLRDPEKFAVAARKMRAAGKPVVALKVGRSSSGAAASAAHTGALATPDTALQAFFHRLGVVLVEDYDELIETCVLFLGNDRKPKSNGVAVLNVSGGELALTCDIAERVGLTLPDLAPATVNLLREILPPFGAPRNPLDATGVAVFDIDMYGACLRALLADPAISLVAISQDCPSTLGKDQAATYRRLAQAVAKVNADAAKPIVFFNNISDTIHPAVLEPLNEASVPSLCGMRNALRAIGHLIDHHAHAEVKHTSVGHLRDEQWAERLASGLPFTERESKAFLADHGIAVTREQLATNADDAASAAKRLGFPVVLKIDSEDIPHKTEVGGVVLNLASEAEVATAFDDLIARVRKHMPQAHINGALVQQQIDKGIEAIVGIATHKPFGPGVLVGSGGVLVELVKDATFDIAPVTTRDASSMIARTRLADLTRGFRGATPADREALAELVSRVSEVAIVYADELNAMDLNPVSVQPIGKGAIVLDALIIPKADNKTPSTTNIGEAQT